MENKAKSKTVSQSQKSVKFLSTENEVQNPCKKCKKIVGQEKAAQCDRCTSWVHLGCCGLSRTEYDFLERSNCEGIKWFCKMCEEDMKGQNDPTDRIAQQGARLDSLSSVLVTLQQQNQLIHQQNQMILQLLQNEGRFESKIKAQVEEVLDNQKERDEKKNNVVVFNIPEGDETEEEDVNNKEDIKKVSKVLEIVCPEIKAEVLNKTSVQRIGRRRRVVGAKPRPIKIKFSGSEIKEKVLKGAKKLKGHDELRTVGISNDRTRMEIEEDRKLKEELEERKKKGENVYISRILRKVVLKDGDKSGEGATKGAPGSGDASPGSQ